MIIAPASPVGVEVAQVLSRDPPGAFALSWKSRYELDLFRGTRLVPDSAGGFPQGRPGARQRDADEGGAAGEVRRQGAYVAKVSVIPRQSRELRSITRGTLANDWLSAHRGALGHTRYDQRL
jgi:hypothetical protein